MQPSDVFYPYISKSDALPLRHVVNCMKTGNSALKGLAFACAQKPTCHQHHQRSLCGSIHTLCWVCHGVPLWITVPLTIYSVTINKCTSFEPKNVEWYDAIKHMVHFVYKITILREFDDTLNKIYHFWFSSIIKSTILISEKISALKNHCFPLLSKIAQFRL